MVSFQVSRCLGLLFNCFEVFFDCFEVSGFSFLFVSRCPGLDGQLF